MELRQLKYFLKAKELLNFTEASKCLYITQSTLSQQIKQLEEELGQPLFNRIGKRITLTEAGELFAFYAERSIRAAEDGKLLLEDLEGLKTGTLKIGLTWGLKSLALSSLKIFNNSYPEVKIEVTFGTTNELMEDLLKQKIDFALTYFDGVHEENFIYESVLTSDMALMVAKDSTLASLKGIKLKEIEQYRLALPVQGFSTRDFLDRVFKKHNILPNIAIETNQTSMIVDLVELGAYQTVLTHATVHNEANLKAIPIKDIDMKREAVVIQLKDSYHKKGVRIFIDLLLNENKDEYSTL
ncbi:LysR substrate-binding domain-containing protein [Myroides sp. M-43]|uniref:LysR substrate-binding domain-containing protein n=1 Tax=Myroides oncorhynchi TaxID=2893756 RepID=UPI001E3B5A89|nr:LysR substrate-binding domain-containing protein [Myroides oncorhynchi]MCC9043256.1 LysR substrate-binding domain-containing protein [Myroides oncorhynchi]